MMEINIKLDLNFTTFWTKKIVITGIYNFHNFQFTGNCTKYEFKIKFQIFR